MFLEFEDLDSLMDAVGQDSRAEGANAAMLDRYPVRFILFDTFGDSKAFISKAQTELKCVLRNADEWIDSSADFDDMLLSRGDFFRGIKDCVRESEKSCVVTPFSELARFYDNTHCKEFDSTISTIRNIESNHSGSHQRIYIPIIGLEEKMSTFSGDGDIIVWRLVRKAEQRKNYLLTLTNGETFGVKNLESSFRVVSCVRQWLQFWKNHNDSDDADEQLLCTSPAIFTKSRNARPDNAFKYTICRDVKQFLSEGLNFGTADITLDDGSREFWQMLAADIDIRFQTSFTQYAEESLGVKPDIDDDAFLKAWFSCAAASINVNFRRWVLCRYYELHSNGYLASALKNLSAYDDNQLCRTIACMPLQTQDANVRVKCLNLLKDNGATLGDDVAEHIVARLGEYAANEGERAALSHVSRLTWQEQLLVLKWVAKGQVSCCEAEGVFPDLAAYLAPTDIHDDLDKDALWVMDYIDRYKKARLLASSLFGQEVDDDLKKRITGEVEGIISERNATSTAFSKWYDSLSAVRNVLFGHDEIDSFFWIDGLGVDWIPFVAKVVKEWEPKGFYLNEVHIAQSQLPSVTSVNKRELQSISADIANNKVGDLDHMAHQHKAADRPKLMEEMVAVRRAVETALSKNAGKRIALVSDHGLTYMSQFYHGLGLQNLNDDHHGRTASYAKGPAPKNDEVYKVLPDGVTVCALRQASLSGKVPAGEGAHGGLTPEECLVPVFIISPFRENMQWQAILLNHTDIGNDPVVRFKIKGTTSGYMPKLSYNGKQYAVSRKEGVYLSDVLNLDNACRKVVISIDGGEQELDIDFTLGAEEDDLF